MDDVKIVVAKNIKKYRESCNMTQKELADMLNTVMSTISNWEKGSNSPDIVKLFMMCKIFGITPSVMMGLDSESDHQKAYRESPKEVQQAIDTLLKQHRQ